VEAAHGFGAIFEACQAGIDDAEGKEVGDTGVQGVGGGLGACDDVHMMM
jgi:hypothetical protein